MLARLADLIQHLSGPHEDLLRLAAAPIAQLADGTGVDDGYPTVGLGDEMRGREAGVATT